MSFQPQPIIYKEIATTKEEIVYPYKVPYWKNAFSEDGPEKLLATEDFFGPQNMISAASIADAAAFLNFNEAGGCDYEGFSLLEKDTILSPTDPSRAVLDSEHLLGYYKKTPADPVLRIKEYTPDELRKGRPPANYAYRLPSFEATETDVAHADTTQVFLYTGNSDKSSPCVKKQIFFRLSDLEARLCGDLEQRRLYELDWLAAFMGHATLKNSNFLRRLIYEVTVRNAFQHMLPAFPPNPNPNDLELYLNLVKKAMEAALGNVNGSHFPTWDEDGRLRSATESAEFLAQLLTPPNAGGKNFPRFVFERFCDLAVAASIGPKAGWNVMARFWSQPLSDTPPVTFTYYLPPPLRSRLSDRTQGYETPLTQEWERIMRSAHKQVYTSEKAKTLTSRFIPAEQCEVILEANDQRLADGSLEQIGAHPQGFYVTFVTRSALDAMRVKDFMTHDQRRNFPLFKENRLAAKIFFSQLRMIFQDSNFSSAYSQVTQGSLILAAQSERWCSQVALMNGMSASDIAVYMKWEDTQRQAEWLHKLAYSFGPLGNSAVPDSAQTPSNLIFGTKESNTLMMRLEHHIKRLVRKYDVAVRVTAWPMYPGDNEQYKNPHVKEWKVGPLSHAQWDSSLLAPALKYKWEFPQAIELYGEKIMGKASTEIDLFSRYYPTRFEVYLDEEVENEIKKRAEDEASIEGSGGKPMTNNRYRRLHKALYSTNDFVQ